MSVDLKPTQRTRVRRQIDISICLCPLKLRNGCRRTQEHHQYRRRAGDGLPGILPSDRGEGDDLTEAEFEEICQYISEKGSIDYRTVIILLI